MHSPRAGNTLYVETINSGPPLFGYAEAGGRGNIISGAVEQSNVDIDLEFVNLISYQRGFRPTPESSPRRMKCTPSW